MLGALSAGRFTHVSDIGLKLTFSDPDTSVAFSRELNTAEPGPEFRVVTLDSKLNYDAATILLVLKAAGTAAGAIAGFVKLAQVILDRLKKPSVKIEIEGKSVELKAKTSVEDIKLLCEILARAAKP
jgi:hypothetical protein